VFLGDNIVASMAVVGPAEGMPTEPDSALIAYMKETAARLSAQLSA
jgi:hypothetical protein